MNSKLKLSEKAGYALGDTAGLLTFSLVSSFLQMFYTDSLHIPLSQITVLMLIARIWDAVNDPIWGGFIDSRKPTKYGRFRPYILGASFPLAAASVLMFTKIDGLSTTGYLIYAYLTYVFYGMMYTGTNIPYGALAAAVTNNQRDRSSLSIIRSIGAALGGLPALIIMPLLVYSTTDKGIKYLDSGKLFTCVLVLALLSVAVYAVHFGLTKEHITVTEKQKTDSYSFKKSAAALLRNRAFIAVSLASMFLIASQMYSQTIYNYLFKDYFNKPSLYIFVTVCTYLPMAVFVLPMNRLVERFGKKELSAAGMGIAAAVNFAAYFIGFTPLSHNPAVFLIILFLSGAGQTFFTLEVWALVMDVTDYHELRTGRKEEGTVYSVYNFIRKIGHTIAGAGSSAALLSIGYDVNASQSGQAKGVSDGFWTLSTLIPALMFCAMFILLRFLYPLTKEKTAEMRNRMNR